MITNGKKSHYLAVTNLSALLEKNSKSHSNNNNSNNNNNIEESYTEKKAKHEPSGWPMFTECSFDKKENKLNYYRGKDCI